MTSWPNPQLRRKLERQAASLAAAILAGRAPLVAGTQRMRKLLLQLGVGDADADLRAFTAIASETDHLPLGSERRHWDAEALRRKDVEIARAEAWARDLGLESCRRLVARFGPGSPPADAATVAVVVDPAFGDGLAELVARMPVWVADTPGNAAAIQRIRRSGRGSLTSFGVDSDDTPEASLAAIIHDVDLHHGVHSQDAPYGRIEVHGARLTEPIHALLGELGFHRFDPAPFGFSASLAAEG